MSEVKISEDTQKRIDELNKEIAEKLENLQKHMIEEGGNLFKQATAEIFEAYPKLHTFSWTQYTPYFNDGDTCEFGVNAEYSLGIYTVPKDYSNETWQEERDLRYEGEYGSSWYRDYRKEQGRMTEEEEWKYDVGIMLAGLINSIPEDTLKVLFGDHAEVFVSREGVEVEEYEHE